MLTTLGPAVETLFALELFLRGGGPPFALWRNAVRLRLGDRAKSLSPLLAGVRAVPNQHRDAADGPFGEDKWVLASADGRRDKVAAGLSDFHQVAVAPYWKRMRLHLEVDRESRARVLMGSGIEGLLATLHPQVTWNSSVLEIKSHLSREVHGSGRGLLIVPSLFLFDRPRLLLDERSSGEAPALVYPAPLDPVQAATLWGNPRCNDQALGALVGRTRAGVLQALTNGCTTTDLGRRLGISPAAASQHTSILRDAGLITSRRRLNTVVHTVTALGSALIKGEPLRPFDMGDGQHKAAS